MAHKKLFLGFVVLVVLALGTTGVAACNGGGGGEVFEGNMLVKNFKITDGNVTENFDGLVNIDVPYIAGSLITGIDTVFITNAKINMSYIPPVVLTLGYMDLAGADVIPTTTPNPPICDEIFGYTLIINEAIVTACSYVVDCP